MTDIDLANNTSLAVTKTMLDLASSAPDSNSIYDGVLRTINDLLGFEYATISVVDRKARTITAKRGIWKGKLDLFPEWIRLSCYPLDHSDIQAVVVRSKEPEVLNGWDNRLNREIWTQFEHDKLVRAIVPIIDETGAVLGTIEAGRAKSPLSPKITKKELESLQYCATQAARTMRIGMLRDVTLEDTFKISQEFSRLLAHETKNATGAIRMNVRLIRNCLPKAVDAKVLDCLETLELTANYLGRFPEPLKLDLLKVEDIDVRDVVDEAVHVVVPPDNVTLNVEPKLQPLTVKSDAHMLKSALVNVLRNAYEAIGSHTGTVTITFEGTGAGTLTVVVRDTGCGMTKEAAESAGRQIYSDKKNGSGIGLFVTTKILRLIGADIELVETGPKGTAFKIILPCPSSRREPPDSGLCR